MPADARDAQYVELNGEVGRLIQQTVLKTFKVSEFMEVVQKTGGTNTGLLPFNCICAKDGRYEKGSRAGVVGSHYRLHVIALKPRVATIRFHGFDVGERHDDPVGTTIRTFALAMPWIFYFVLYQNNGLARVVMAASSELDGLSRKGMALPLSAVPLPNIYQGGNFCLGELKLDSSQAFHEKTNRIVQYIDESTWNNDLWPQLGKADAPHLLPNIFSLRHWAEQTQEQGQAFWRTLRLQSLNHTFEQMIKELTQ